MEQFFEHYKHKYTVITYDLKGKGAPKGKGVPKGKEIPKKAYENIHGGGELFKECIVCSCNLHWGRNCKAS